MGRTVGGVRASSADSTVLRGVRAVLFDFDGTLITQQIDFGRMRSEVLEVVARYGVDPEPLQSMYVLELIRMVHERLDDETPPQGARFEAEASAVIASIELEAAKSAHPFAGVVEMLRTLRDRDYRVGIVTRNCRLAVEQILASRAMHHDLLLTRDDVPHVKPDPRHLSTALEALNVPPESAVMCGDHPMDVLVGKRVGTATVGVLPVGKTREYFGDPTPDLILLRVTELLDYLSDGLW